MQTFHLRAARYSLYVLFPCLALHFLNEHVIGGDTPCFESASARCCTLCCAICTTQQKAKAENNQGGHGHLGWGHHLQCQGRNWREGCTRQQGTERLGSPWKPESSWRSGRAGEGAVMSSFTGYFPLTSSQMPGWSL